ncbi:DUF1844 domain-containing protein [Candidatus Omnitrophota bacterium]
MSEENKKPTREELSEFMFIQYISMLANSGMQQLGKIMNPVSGKMEKSMEGAQVTIEILSMLKEKTKGNLTANEEKVISDGLANLQLNYADEVSRIEKENTKTK